MISCRTGASPPSLGPHPSHGRRSGATPSGAGPGGLPDLPAAEDALDLARDSLAELPVGLGRQVDAVDAVRRDHRTGVEEALAGHPGDRPVDLRQLQALLPRARE